jgi:hypothetical protein
MTEIPPGPPLQKGGNRGPLFTEGFREIRLEKKVPLCKGGFRGIFLEN